jgi:hypothetical protein
VIFVTDNLLSNDVSYVYLEFLQKLYINMYVFCMGVKLGLSH